MAREAKKGESPPHPPPNSCQEASAKGQSPLIPYRMIRKNQQARRQDGTACLQYLKVGFFANASQVLRIRIHPIS
jgi:hypothetical protein